jgi:hypothetical protein
LVPQPQDRGTFRPDSGQPDRIQEVGIGRVVRAPGLIAARLLKPREIKQAQPVQDLSRQRRGFSQLIDGGDGGNGGLGSR